MNDQNVWRKIMYHIFVQELKKYICLQNQAKVKSSSNPVKQTMRKNLKKNSIQSNPNGIFFDNGFILQT